MMSPSRKQCYFRLFVLMVVVFALNASAVKSQDTTSARQVRLTITITDKSGRYVGTLRKDQVTLFDEKAPQELTLFQEGTSVPASIGLCWMSQG